MQEVYSDMALEYGAGNEEGNKIQCQGFVYIISMHIRQIYFVGNRRIRHVSWHVSEILWCRWMISGLGMLRQEPRPGFSFVTLKCAPIYYPACINIRSIPIDMASQSKASKLNIKPDRMAQSQSLNPRWCCDRYK